MAYPNWISHDKQICWLGGGGGVLKSHVTIRKVALDPTIEGTFSVHTGRIQCKVLTTLPLQFKGF